MPKQSSEKKIAMPWPKNINIPEEVRKKHPYLQDRFEDQLAFQGKEDGSEAEWIDAGAFGMVGDIGGGKVEKLTYDDGEYKEALKIIDLQKKSGGSIPCVIHIYAVEDLGGGNYRIIAEKVRVLSIKDKKVMWAAFDLAQFYGQALISKKFDVDLHLYKITEDVIKAGLRAYGEKYYVAGEDDGRPLTNEIFDCLIKVINIIKCLRYNGLSSNDFHTGNFGFREDGSLVLLDLGLV